MSANGGRITRKEVFPLTQNRERLRTSMEVCPLLSILLPALIANVPCAYLEDRFGLNRSPVLWAGGEFVSRLAFETSFAVPPINRATMVCLPQPLYG